MLRVIMIGNLGGDAETRDAGGSQVASFNVASTRKFKGRDGMQEETEWLKVEYWNPQGVLPYLLKGQPVFVEGDLRTERWKDRNGADCERKKVVASIVQLLGKKADDDSPKAPARQAAGPSPAPRNAPMSAPAWQRSPTYTPPQAAADKSEDDLPL